MLELLRKQMRGILIATICLIIPSFVIFYGARQSARRPQTLHAGEIYGRKVPLDEYRRSLYWTEISGRMRYGEQFDHIRQFLNLEREAWQNIVLFEEAEREGIRVSDEELALFITSLPIFAADEGSFDRVLYQNILAYALGVTANQFEGYMRKWLAISRLKESVRDSARATEAEARRFFNYLNESVNAEYVVFKAEEFLGQADVSDEALKEYFFRNREAFRIPEERMIEYVRFEINPENIELSEEELKEYYRRSPGLFAADKTDDSAEAATKPFSEVRSEIRELLETRKAVAEAVDRADEFILNLEEGYAYWENAERQASGYFKISGAGAPHRRIAQEAFSSEPGTLSPAVATPEAVYVFKVAGIRPGYVPEDYSAVKGELLQKARAAFAARMASEKALELFSLLKESGDFSASAAAFGKTPAETGYFTREAPIQELGRAGEFTSAAFAATPSRPFAVAPVRDGTAVLRLSGRQSPEPERFEQDRERFVRYAELEKSNRVFKDWFTAVQMESGARFFLEGQEF